MTRHLVELLVRQGVVHVKATPYLGQFLVHIHDFPMSEESIVKPVISSTQLLVGLPFMLKTLCLEVGN